MTTLLVLLITATLLWTTQARQGFGPGDQDWGYVEVRPHAHMFWWLHHTTADKEPTNRPLLVWIQGGPGASSSGEGNIYMSGLVNENLELRDFSYVHLANVLYVDNPVGAGYSYVDTEKGGTFATNTTEMTNDYVALLKAFFKEHQEFEQVPLYLVGESYGGKLAPIYAQRILEEVSNGDLKVNLQGVGMAYPATQLLPNIASIADVLFAAGIVDTDGYKEISHETQSILDAAHQNKWVEASSQMDQLLLYVMNTYGLEFFSVIKNSLEPLDLSELNDLMDNTVSPILNITTKFGVQRDLVSQAVADRLQPTTDSVMYLLDNTNVKIAIYNGQLDWVVNSIGTYSWVNNLTWYGSAEWNNVDRDAFYWDGIHEGHVKAYDRLAFYWIKRAGHRLPNDNPNAMKYILKQLIGY